MPSKGQPLAKIQKNLAEILDALPGGVFIKDAEHLKFVYLNESAEQFFGYSREEMIGNTDYDFFPEDQADFFTSKDRDVFKEGKMIDIFEEPITLADGETKWLHTKKIPFYETDEKDSSKRVPLFLVGIFEDITERKEIEDKLKFARREIERKYNETQSIFKVILDNTVDGFVTTDEKGVIQTYNQACNAMFGFELNEAVLFNIDKLIPELNQKAFDTYQKELEGQEGKVLEIKGLGGKNSNGELFPIDITLKLLGGDDGISYILIIHDITKEVAAEKQREKYLQALETKNRELNDFTYIASHDLKGPLRGIHNYSNFLLEDYEDKLDDEGKNMLHSLTSLTQQLENYLDTLLHYSRLGRDDLNFEKVNLNHLAEEVASLYSPELQEKNVKFTIGELPEALCDSVQLREVINNLINNALKYSDNKNNVIEIGAVDNDTRHPEHHVLYVSDNGIGIDPKFHESVFTIFKRLHTKDAYGGGSGSGLTISQKIINRHGGHMWVESEGKGAGCKVLFSLPKNH